LNELAYQKNQEKLILQQLALLKLEKEAKQSDFTFSKMIMSYAELKSIQKLEKSAKIIQDNIFLLNDSYFNKHEQKMRREIRNELEKLKTDYKHIFIAIFEIKRKKFEEETKKFSIDLDELSKEIDKFNSFFLF
jgi:hypothetical protein